jgi:hypothetical protein
VVLGHKFRVVGHDRPAGEARRCRHRGGAPHGALRGDLAEVAVVSLRFSAGPAATAKPSRKGADGPAKTVAAKLSRHRPGNLVEFSYREGGATKRSAAVVSLFHGRYCIYTAEKGTVPFLRGTGSVQLTTRITASLRRLFTGGVTGVESVGW